MIIRQGTESDLNKIGRLWLEMVRELTPNYTPMLDWWKAITINLMRNNKEYYVFVADDNGKIVGFLDFLLLAEASTGKVQALGRHYYVKPEYRKTKIASEIYHESCEEAIKRGAKAFTLLCLPKGVRFWKKRGFKIDEVSMRMEM